MNLPVLDSHAPPLRVMSLHAWAYCPRLFYLEEVEEIRVADDRVYAGRGLHASLEDEEEGEPSQFEFTSERLGLTGKVDCLRRRDGTYIPYEHKRGRARRDDRIAAAWPSDRLQVVAYALLIEEAFDQRVEEGRVRYHADNVTVRVPIDEAARADLHSAIQAARELRETDQRPPVADNERLCQHCSLAPVCLPEEVRCQRDESHEPVRLFPPDRDGASLHVVAQGAYVGRSGDCLVVKPREGTPSKNSIREIDSVLLHGYAQISTQALRLCVSHSTSVHWLTVGGHHLGSLTPTAGQVQRRIRQFRALCDESTCVRLSRTLAIAKVAGQHGYLLRASRGQQDVRKRLLSQLAGIHEELSSIGQGKTRDEIRGHEGRAAVHYFEGLKQIVGDQVPDGLRFVTRNRRPPLDRFNALLGFGYGLVHAAVMRGVLACGLDPAFGFFHTPRSAAYPLVLDLMELYRVPLWDMPLIGSLNRGQWDPGTDFVITRGKVWLSDDGRKKAIGLFENRLTEKWKHPVLKYSLSYSRTIELEARLLEKEWSGEPGLFAQFRIR